MNEGLELYRADLANKSAPIIERLEVIDNLLIDYQEQLNRLLELYITGGVSKEFLTDHQSRLENTINALTRERKTLEIQLNANTLSDEEKLTLEHLIEQVVQKLSSPAIDGDFELRQSIIEAFDVQVTLTVEENKKIAYMRCNFGETSLCVNYNPTHTTALYVGFQIPLV